MTAAFPIAARHKDFDLGYLSELETYCDQRQIMEPRGRVLGGSSSKNGMVTNGENPIDYDQWSRNGLKNWAFKYCLPYFRKMETSDTRLWATDSRNSKGKTLIRVSIFGSL